MKPGTLTGTPGEPGYEAAAFRLGRGALVIALAAVILWFGLLDHRSLWEPDEGRYAEIAREMVASGDWTTPRLNALVYLEKPPLQYWATAAAFEIFGQSNWTARLWTALTGLAGVLLVFYAGQRLYSTLAGMYAALILGSGLLYFGAGHFNSLDMALTFFTQATIFAFALALQPRATPAEHRIWMHVMWIASALALLTKGLIGVVLPGATVVLYSAIFRDFSVWKRLSPVSGGALLLVIAVPWFVAVTLANPDFPHFFFVHEHFERYLTTQHHRYQPFWFFVPVFLLGALPWTLPMLKGLWSALRHPRPGAGFSCERFLAVWSIFVFVFFSLSNSKLVGYIVPVLPALALLAGRYLCTVDPAALRRQLLPVLLVPALLVAGIIYIVARGPDGNHAGIGAVPYLAAAAALVAGGALYAFRSLSRATLPALLVLAFVTMASTQALFAGAEVASPQRTSRQIARQIGPHLTASTRIYSVGIYPQSLPVYLGRTVTLVAFRGELDYGLDREPQKGIPTIAAFREEWLQRSDAVAIMDRATYAYLQTGGLPMIVIGEDATRVAVRRT